MGLSIGIVFLAFFFKKKSETTGVSFCYFPNCRPLKDLRSKPISYSDEIQTLLANKQLDTLTIINFFQNGDVDFGRSDTESKPCKTYFIEDFVHEKERVLQVRNCPTEVLVEKLRRNADIREVQDAPGKKR